MTSPSTGTTGQTEWAVVCPDGIWERAKDAVAALGMLRAKERFCDRFAGCCGPHRVVSRTVGPWTEDE